MSSAGPVFIVTFRSYVGNVVKLLCSYQMNRLYAGYVLSLKRFLKKQKKKLKWQIACSEQYFYK